MAKTLNLVRGGEVFTLLDLLEKAAEFEGLKLEKKWSKAISKPIKSYQLDRRLLSKLAEKGIKKKDRPDDVFTLVDENPQQVTPGWRPSNYWNFKRPDHNPKKDFDLRIELRIGFRLSQEDRGFMLVPLAYGTFLSPTDALPNYRMFRALVEGDEMLPLVAKRMVKEEIVITWTDLGLGGLRRMSELFGEFAQGKDSILHLGHNGDIFSPVPLPRYEQPGGELFVAEVAQPKLFRAWREQLGNYRSKLTA